MHAYPPDSPAAISRILALAMIVDGELDSAELSTMQHAPFLQQVGVDALTFEPVLHALCADLLADAEKRGAAVVEIDPDLLDTLLADVRDPLLQICLWKTMVDMVQADGRVDGRESILVRRAARLWFKPGREAVPGASDTG